MHLKYDLFLCSVEVMIINFCYEKMFLRVIGQEKHPTCRPAACRFLTKLCCRPVEYPTGCCLKAMQVTCHLV
jgi:hypothetical protein